MIKCWLSTFHVSRAVTAAWLRTAPLACTVFCEVRQGLTFPKRVQNQASLLAPGLMKILASQKEGQTTQLYYPWARICAELHPDAVNQRQHLQRLTNVVVANVF